MSSEELHYVPYDPEETWDEAMKTYIGEGGDVLYPGDEKEILLRAALAMATAICAKIDNGLRMDTRQYATGEYLKIYGDKRNCPYIEAVTATAPVEISFRLTSEARVIPAGTELTEDGVMIYLTTEDIRQTGTVQTVRTVVKCQRPGTIGNGLREGAQLQFVQSNDAVIRVVVLENASGGVDAEDEEAYRERIGYNGLASVTTGSAQMYESKVRAVSPQIIDVKALNNGGGEVGIYIILAEGADRSAIFTAVERALRPDDDRPLTDHVQVHDANEKPYTLSVKVWYSAYAALGDAVVKAVKEYQVWQDHHMARAFNPDMLVAMLYQLGCERVQYQSGSGMNGSLEYTEIPLNAHCKGTINLEVVNT